jgi:hypothetical protein
MAAVNYERAWLQLKAKLAEKPSHSAKELFDSMSRIEVENMRSEEEELFDGSPLHVR